MVRIGILGLQGGVYEHYYMLRKIRDAKKLDVDVVIVKKPRDLTDLDGLIIPGGESTTIGVLARKTGVFNYLRDMIVEGLPVMGTCAGAILLAKKVRDRVVGEVNQTTLGVMNVEIVRNYFGRQRESFELDLSIKGFDNKSFRGVFIRAPAITRYWGAVEPLAEITYNGEKVVVMAREKSLLATMFHPELTSDTRIHELFLDMVKK